MRTKESRSGKHDAVQGHQLTRFDDDEPPLGDSVDCHLLLAGPVDCAVCRGFDGADRVR